MLLIAYTPSPSFIEECREVADNPYANSDHFIQRVIHPQWFRNYEEHTFVPFPAEDVLAHCYQNRED